MKIKRGRFSKKMWVVNSKGKRITQKCEYVSKKGTYGVFEVINLERGLYAPMQTIMFDTRKEEQFKFISHYSKITDDLFAFGYDDNLHFYNAKGKLLREGISRYYISYKDKFINALIDGKIYFCDYVLNILSDGFANATNFDEFGYSVVRQCKTGYYGVINTDMEFVIAPFECDGITPLSKNYFKVDKAHKCEVIDVTKKVIIPAACWREICFVSGYFRVLYNNKLGLFDKEGKVIFDCIYPEIIETPDKFVVKDFAKLETMKTKEVTK